jgi:hypothetical protein
VTGLDAVGPTACYLVAIYRRPGQLNTQAVIVRSMQTLLLLLETCQQVLGGLHRWSVLWSANRSCGLISRTHSPSPYARSSSCQKTHQLADLAARGRSDGARPHRSAHQAAAYMAVLCWTSVMAELSPRALTAQVSMVTPVQKLPFFAPCWMPKYAAIYAQ